MLEKFKRYEANIKRKHSFSWNPKFEGHFNTRVNEKVFGTLATKTIEDLGWEEAVIHSDALVSTKRKGGLTANTEKITIEFKLGKITVRSRSAPNGVWDNGQNSKRVLLFIYAFQEVVKTYDKKGLAHLEELVEDAAYRKHKLS
jgi:hypothetical protein